MTPNKRVKQEEKGTKLGDLDHVTHIANLDSLPGSEISDRAYILVSRDKDSYTGKSNGNIDRQLTPREFGQHCILYKDGAGNYFPSPVAFDRIPIPDAEKDEWRKLPKNERSSQEFRYRNEIWQRENHKLGITNNKIYFDKDERFYPDKGVNKGRLSPQDQIIKTEFGDRKVEKRYKYPFQAGTDLPDIMIMTGKGDVHLIDRHANDNFVGRGFEEFRNEVRKAYGDDAEIKLKSSSGILHDAKYLDMWEKQGADRRFRSFVGETLGHDLELPKATVNIGRRPDGQGGYTRDHHVSIEALKQLSSSSMEVDSSSLQESARNWIDALEKGKYWDRVQLRTRDGNGYISPNRMSYSDGAQFREIMQDVGLPLSMGEQRQSKAVKFEGFEQNAPALVRNGPQLRDARDFSPEELQKLSPSETLIADYNDKGQRTGTYTSAAEYQRLGKTLPDKAAADLGVSSDMYSKDFAKPQKYHPPIYDSRERSSNLVR